MARHELRLLEPDDVYGHALLGYAAFERGELRDGVQALRRALQLDPADQDILSHLGISLESAGKATEALEVGQKMIANEPLSPMAGGLGVVVRSTIRFGCSAAHLLVFPATGWARIVEDRLALRA